MISGLKEYLEAKCGVPEDRLGLAPKEIYIIQGTRQIGKSYFQQQMVFDSIYRMEFERLRKIDDRNRKIDDLLS
jgi:hypothetical protein